MEHSPVYAGSRDRRTRESFSSYLEAANCANSMGLAQESWFWISDLKMKGSDPYHLEPSISKGDHQEAHACFSLSIFLARIQVHICCVRVYAYVNVHVYDVYVVCLKPQCVFVPLFLGQVHNYLLSLCLQL